MAIYRLEAKIVRRSCGHSVTAAAAYRSGERIHDQRTGQTFDYTRRRCVAHRELLLPAEAPSWSRDRSTLWNAVEAAERRKDAQLAREFILALPHELSLEDNLGLLRRFVFDHLVAHGMAADVAVHLPSRIGQSVVPKDALATTLEAPSVSPERAAPSTDDKDLVGNVPLPGGDLRQVHAHVLVPLRPLGAEGFAGKTRAWNDRRQLLAWREAWAECVNDALATAGLTQRVDHRTLAAQRADALRRGDAEAACALDRIPQPKVGPASKRRGRCGKPAGSADDYRAVIRANEARAERYRLERQLRDIEDELRRLATAEAGLVRPGAALQLASTDPASLTARESEQYLKRLGILAEHNDLLVTMRGCARRLTAHGIDITDTDQHVAGTTGTEAEVKVMVLMAYLKGWKEVTVEGNPALMALARECLAEVGIRVAPASIPNAEPATREPSTNARNDGRRYRGFEGPGR